MSCVCTERPARPLLNSKMSINPRGAADPKVEARWNLYHDYASATDLLRRLAAAHPELCRLQSLGKSYGGRDVGDDDY